MVNVTNNRSYAGGVKTTADVIAPGHVFLKRLSSGIKYTAQKVYLVDKGNIISEAVPVAKSAWDYFYSLEFTKSFPQVTHWYFHSAWTQKVRLTRPMPDEADDTTVRGYVQFIDEKEPTLMYQVTYRGETTKPIISVPMPPNEEKPVNIPLRLAMGKIAASIAGSDDEFSPNKWEFVTSLVPVDEIDDVFPTGESKYTFEIEGQLGVSLREYLCRVQGLKPEK
jgi:hypothetical protein